jgi:hypothetical protein
VVDMDTPSSSKIGLAVQTIRASDPEQTGRAPRKVSSTGTLGKHSL